jgi:cysteine sulfinate desulfinase/cysteine desulfurase-like protein
LIFMVGFCVLFSDNAKILVSTGTACSNKTQPHDDA